MSRKINYNIIQMLILVGLTFCIVLLCIQILDFCGDEESMELC